MKFEWDERKNLQNQKKHGLSFEFATLAFEDEKRIILEDKRHSDDEARFYCVGKAEDHVITVRFTYRNEIVRIYGAGVWRKTRRLYERKNT